MQIDKPLLKVLIADSAQKTAEHIVTALEPWKGGVVWESTSSGEATFDALIKNAPDVAFVDVTNLTGCSGPEVVARARKLGNKSLIVLMSQLVMPQWAAISTELGAYEFLRKPFNDLDLNSIINAHFKMKSETRVLLVEPAPTARQILRRMMDASQFNMNVEETDNGSHALKLVKLSQYDVAFVDLHLPGLGGLEVACQLQSQCPDLAVVLMSGQKSGSLATTAERFGIGFHLNKPFFKLDLDLMMHSALKLRRTYLHNALLRNQIAKKEMAEKQALLTGTSA